MAHNYDIGTKAWQPDTTEGWIASEVVSKTQDGDKYKLVFELANGEVGYPVLILMHRPYLCICLLSAHRFMNIDQNHRDNRGSLAR
jgi:hypothetical protein